MRLAILLAAGMGFFWATMALADAVAAQNDATTATFPVPRMTPQRTDVAPFTYSDVGKKIPNYTRGEKWGVQGEPLSRMQDPLPAEESLKHFIVPEGFRVELFAAEPDLGGKPIAVNWDERGRLWVCETYDYPNEQQPRDEGRDRIRICEDTNGDGRADKFTVFAEQLSIPTSLTFARGGAIVLDGAETVFLKDTNGDDVADERRVLFGIGLFVYDMDGKPLWNRPFEAKDTQYNWGTSISPILYEDRLYLVNDNDEKSYLLALDKKTGEEKLRVDREGEKTNYATPFVWKNELRTELVTSGVGWARSYDLEGNLLWKIKGKSILAIPTPFAHDGLLYLIAGHVLWGENPVYAIRPGASGDISPVEPATSNDYVVWSTSKAGPYHPTPIIYEGVLNVLYDRGFMTAFDPKSGEEIYPRKRIPNGRAFTSSPWAYGGKLFCLNEDGVTFVLKAGKQFEILHSNPLAADDMGMATPVVVGDKLLIRTSARVYCIAPTSVAAASQPRSGDSQ